MLELLIAIALSSLGTALFVSLFFLLRDRHSPSVEESQAKLEETESTYRTLFEMAPDVIYSIEAQHGTFQSLSPAFTTTTGWQPEEWIGKPFVEILHPDDVQKARGEFAKRIRGELSPPFELRVRAKNGSYLIGEFRSRPKMVNGKVVGDFGIARDITDRRLQEERVKQETAKLQTIIASIGDGVFAVDTSGLIILMNPAAERLSGYTQDEALGKYYSHIFRFEIENVARAAYPDFVKEVISSGKPGTLTTHSFLRKKNEERIPISDMATPFLDVSGAILGAVVVFRDSTQEREVERSKDEFISVASHQLRTPLGSMRWSLELLLSLKDLPSEALRTLQQIHDNNQRMIELVNDLLTVSRIDQGRIQEKPEATSLVTVIQAVLSDLHLEAEHRGVTLQFSPPATVPQIWVDPHRLREIIENLVINAIKYNRPQGSVVLSISADQNKVRLQIADTGIGIPESEKDHIFTKFFRATNVLRSETEGNGLGLYVVKSLVEHWGGKIWFESEENTGTTFWVELPALSPTEEKTA